MVMVAFLGAVVGGALPIRGLVMVVNGRLTPFVRALCVERRADFSYKQSLWCYVLMCLMCIIFLESTCKGTQSVIFSCSIGIKIASLALLKDHLLWMILIKWFDSVSSVVSICELETGFSIFDIFHVCLLVHLMIMYESDFVTVK